MTEFNDGSQYRIVSNPTEHLKHRRMFETRVCSAKNGRDLYIDTAFRRHRSELGPHLEALLLYAFPYQNAGSPEAQARYFIDALGGSLRPNEMVMLDTESGSGLNNPADFMRRWCAVVERTLDTLAWIYVPMDLSRALNRSVTGDRLTKKPRYSGGPGKGKPPTWEYDPRRDAWQYTDKGWFPGCPQSGDCNTIDLTISEMLTRCRRPGGGGAPPRPTLRRGDTGPAVTDLQNRLNAAGV